MSEEEINEEVINESNPEEEEEEIISNEQYNEEEEKKETIPNHKSIEIKPETNNDPILNPQSNQQTNQSQQPKSNLQINNPHQPQSPSQQKEAKSPTKHNANLPQNIKTTSPLQETSQAANYKEKTIFTKLSEEMYTKMMKKTSTQSTKEPFSYDSFIKDEFLCFYSEKFNKENKNIIKDFIDRSTKESKRKQMGFIAPKGIYSNKSKDTVLTKSNHQTTSQDNIHHNTKPKTKSTRTTAQFIKDQDMHNRDRESRLSKLKEQHTIEANKLIKPIPTIDSHSVELSKRREKTAEKEGNNSDVYSKLYEEHNRKRKMSALSTRLRSESKKKVVKSDEVNVLINKLYTDAKNRHQKSKENLKRKESAERIMNDYTNDYSNNIIMNKLILQFDNVIKELFNVRKEDNIQININDFALLLFKLGFTIKNYSESKDSIEKEYQLIQSSWSVLTRKKTIDIKEKVQSYFILLFLLSVSNLYKGKEAKPLEEKDNKANNKAINNNTNEEHRLCLLIKRNLPFFDDKVIYFEPNLAKQIVKSFRLFNDNRKNYLKQRKDISSSKAPKINEKQTSKPKLTTNQKYKINEAYGMRREQTLQKLRIKQNKEELKECTFYPNNKKPLKRSVSADVSVRLYTNVKRRQNQKDLVGTNTNNDPMLLATNSNNNTNEEECTFRPQLTEFNKNIFDLNPIKDDHLISNEIERYEKARIDRKVKGYLLSQGYHSLNKLKTGEELLKDLAKKELSRDFKFQNEKKTNKDTFDKYDLPKNNTARKGKGTLLFTFEIKIDNDMKTLLIHQGDDIIAKAKGFCKQNNLGRESKDQIIAAIKEKVNQ